MRKGVSLGVTLGHKGCSVGDLCFLLVGDLFLASLARGSMSTLSVGMGCGRA